MGFCSSSAHKQGQLQNRYSPPKSLKHKLIQEKQEAREEKRKGREVNQAKENEQLEKLYRYQQFKKFVANEDKDNISYASRVYIKFTQLRGLLEEVGYKNFNENDQDCM